MRKHAPAGWEAYFFKGGTGSHVFETEFGRIGVGICYDNYYCSPLQEMYEQSVNLVLMPHSAPMFDWFPPEYVEPYLERLSEIAPHYAGVLGVPVVMANKSGPFTNPQSPGPATDSSFPGLSAIIDSDGSVMARLSDEETIIVKDVTLDPSRKSIETPECDGRFIFEQDLLKLSFTDATESAGLQWYTASDERKTRAREISSGH